MAAELLLYHLRVLERLASEPIAPEDAYTQRQRLIHVMHRRHRLDPSDQKLKSAVDELEALQHRATDRQPAIFSGYEKDGPRRRARYTPEDELTRAEYHEIYKRHAAAIDEAQGALYEQLERRDMIRIGPRRTGRSIPLGERLARQREMKEFRHELGPKFIAPQTPLTARAVQVRKWRQLMRARQPE